MEFLNDVLVQPFADMAAAPDFLLQVLWEGLVGGVVFSSLASLLLLAPLADLAPGYALLVGAILGVVGQVGDLAESLLKRDAGVKDSGSVLPGFGGVLDLIDSPLVAAPVAYWLIAAA